MNTQNKIARGSISEAYEIDNGRTIRLEANFSIIDRNTGKTSKTKIAAIGPITNVIKDSWYDGYIGRFVVAPAGEGLAIMALAD